MTWDMAYLALNASVVPAWALLLLAPRARATTVIVHSGLYPVALGVVYLVSLGAALVLGQSAPGAGMTSLGGVCQNV